MAACSMNYGFCHLHILPTEVSFQENSPITAEGVRLFLTPLESHRPEMEPSSLDIRVSKAAVDSLTTCLTQREIPNPQDSFICSDVDDTLFGCALTLHEFRLVSAHHDVIELCKCAKKNNPQFIQLINYFQVIFTAYLESFVLPNSKNKRFYLCDPSANKTFQDLQKRGAKIAALTARLPKHYEVTYRDVADHIGIDLDVNLEKEAFIVDDKRGHIFYKPGVLMTRSGKWKAMEVFFKKYFSDICFHTVAVLEDNESELDMIALNHHVFTPYCTNLKLFLFTDPKKYRDPKVHEKYRALYSFIVMTFPKMIDPALLKELLEPESIDLQMFATLFLAPFPTQCDPEVINGQLTSRYDLGAYVMGDDL